MLDSVNLAIIVIKAGISNGGVACDVADGPCACGAWHNKKEMIRRLRSDVIGRALLMALGGLDPCGMKCDQDNNSHHPKCVFSFE